MIGIHTVPGAFSAGECDAICACAAAHPRQEAALVGQVRDHNLRRAELVWLDEAPDTGWIMARIIDVVRQANRETFGFDITEFAESPQIALYRAAREGHFDWHADIGDGRLAAKRKLTMVVQLTAPGAYDGGDLELMPSAQVTRAARDRGSATLFPSFLLHRVTPVRRGQRQSLTTWCHGPAFR